MGRDEDHCRGLLMDPLGYNWHVAAAILHLFLCPIQIDVLAGKLGPRLVRGCRVKLP